MKTWKKEIYLEIKWAYQRARYGYDDTIKWSFEDYFSQFIKPLKEFCEEELKSEYIDNNPDHKEIFEKTLKLIKNHDTAEFGMPSSKATFDLWGYFGAHIGYYWN